MIVERSSQRPSEAYVVVLSTAYLDAGSRMGEPNGTALASALQSTLIWQVPQKANRFGFAKADHLALLYPTLLDYRINDENVSASV